MSKKQTLVSSVSSVAITDEVKSLSLYSSQPAAGFPSPGDDLVEKPLDLNDLLIENPTATFFVRVAGDSMEGAKIFDGDILVVDRSQEPRNGSIVVAAVYGELVVKRLKKDETSLALISENEGYDPIVINDGEDCFVWGVVTGSARVL
jgi:DNA polymerase V